MKLLSKECTSQEELTNFVNANYIEAEEIASINILENSKSINSDSKNYFYLFYWVEEENEEQSNVNPSDFFKERNY